MLVPHTHKEREVVLREQERQGSCSLLIQKGREVSREQEREGSCSLLIHKGREVVVKGTRERRFLLSFDDARRHAKIVLLPLD
jgi:hypothetical protein